MRRVGGVCHRSALDRPAFLQIGRLGIGAVVRVAGSLRTVSGGEIMDRVTARPRVRSGDRSSGRVRRFVAPVSVIVAAALVSACSNSTYRDEGAGYSPRVVSYGEPVPRGGGRFKLGSPYRVGGRIYVPRHDPSYDRNGIASWYGRDFHGRKTANGEVYDMDAMSAAHPTLPLPSYVRVTNLENNRSIVVRVNDRGPFKPGRIVDLSKRAAHQLGFLRQGTARVNVRYLGPARL